VKAVLWDDDAFKQRVAVAAKRKGMTVTKALVAAGASRFYLNKRVEGRSTNTLLNIARVVDAPPIEMFGLADERPPPPDDAAADEMTLSAIPDSDRLQRVTVMARMIAAQLAALVYVASSKSDADPAVLMEFVMREISRGQPLTSEESGGSSS
jgi:hypothetical protein